MVSGDDAETRQDQQTSRIAIGQVDVEAASRRESRAAERCQAGTRPSWTSERPDTLRLRTSEEGSGERAPASASGASSAHENAQRRSFLCERRRRPRILDVRAADLQEEMAEQRFSVAPGPTKTAATQRTSQRAERAIRQSAIREQLKNAAIELLDCGRLTRRWRTSASA
jgi:hypothetical protein